MGNPTSRTARCALLLLFAIVLNSAYLASTAAPTLFYIGNVLLHILVGAALVVLFAVLLWRERRIFSSDLGRTLALVFAAAASLGIFLTVAGATTAHRWERWGHIAAGILTALLVGQWLRRESMTAWPRYRLLLVLALLMPVVSLGYQHFFPNPRYLVRNPVYAPLSMDQEGGGPNGPFFPSAATTVHGGKIPSDFFMESQTCKRCHREVYEQWASSMHHFASFNNQFYRKSVEYMQDVVGTRPSKWCAGCHDHALLFNGMFDTPIQQTVHTPEAQAGLGCMSCHSIVQIKDTMGNGGFVIEYPPMHKLAASPNPILRALHDFLVYANPEPHRRSFLKPFHRQNASEFCSACHKVHLDVPVNHYRWIRGFNEYDNWQASGVSGQGARSFYYPPSSQTCVDCHMPRVPSQDVASKNGMILSHRFAAANTAVAYVNQDGAQLEATEKFLRDKIISVDIFALSAHAPPARGEGAGQPAEAPRPATTFAVGEEAMLAAPVAHGAAVAELAAPIERAQPVLRPGETVRLDVVVRTRKVGHFFPGGTVDAFDVWVELEGFDDQGNVFFWSGLTEDDPLRPGSGRQGPVEPGAHFYRAFLLDAHGNFIGRRNAFMARSTLYVRLIPPGAADTVHYKVQIPESVRGRVHFRARVNYRKFSWLYTNFAYRGQPHGVGRAPANTGNARFWTRPPEQAPSVAPGYDDRPFGFEGGTTDVSGKVKEVPDLPIVVLAEKEVNVEVGRKGKPSVFRTVLDPADRERWNDYGIGLLLQGDLIGAGQAFRTVTEVDPKWPDGCVNMARALIQEGRIAEARAPLERALALAPNLARAHFFKALAAKADGDYDAALAELRLVQQQYPHDRVVLNQIGRILFLQRHFRGAIDSLTQVLRIDPEDVAAHFNLMLAYRGLGDEANAEREEKIYLRYKAEEASQSITGPVRQLHPEDNNERQPIHEHVSAEPAQIRQALTRSAKRQKAGPEPSD